MAVRKVWLGSTGPFLYDESVLYVDEDGVISPDNQQAIATDGQIVIQSAPSSPVHAVRKQDLDDALGDISGLESRVDILEDTTAGLGTMSVQNANGVYITGGAVSSTSVWSLSAAVGAATFLNEVGFGRAPLAGYSLIAEYQSRFQSNLAVIGRMSGYSGITLNNYAGDSATGIYSDLTAAGGANRWFIYHVGNAPSYFSGNFGVDSNTFQVDAVNHRVGIGTYTPVTTLDVRGGDVRIYTKLHIGTNPYGYPTKLELLWNKSGEHCITHLPSTDAGGYAVLMCLNAGGTQIGSITQTSSVVSFNTTSDKRLKHAIKSLTGAMDVVKAMRPVSFLWNADGSPGEGFLAHELQAVVPSSVSGEPDEINVDGSVKPQQVDNSKLVPWLTAALQETIEQVKELAARVVSLEQQLNIQRA